MNTSGIKPVEYKVLIKPEAVEEKTVGGLFIPAQAQDKEKFAKVRGLLVAVGAIAFTDPEWLDHPKVGDLVLYDRYAGSLVTGLDNVEYRLINDKEIGAILEGWS
jgi:chaperonin GroES